MDGSGSSNWTFSDMYVQTSSEMLGISTENVSGIQLTCEEIQEQFGQLLPIPVNVETVLRYIQAVYYINNFVFGVLLNLLVIVLTLRFKKLQNVTFLLGVQVCIGMMLNGTIFLPTAAANAIAGRFVFTGLCSLFGFALFFLGHARTYLMFVLVFDRFCTVFVPFWYQKHRVRVVIVLSFGAWMLAFMVALVPVKGLLDCYSVERNGWACYPNQGCYHQESCLTYTWTVLTLTNISGVASLVMYLLLFCKARKLRNKVAIVNISVEEERAATAQKLKRDRRANVTFFLFYLALIGVSLPPVILLLIGWAIVTIGGVALPTAYSVLEVLAGSSFSVLIIVDPIVIMRNEDFREVIKKLLNKITVQTRNCSGVLAKS